MSAVYTEIDDIAWEDVALRKIFLECLASSNSSTSSISSFSSLPSTSSEVYVHTLVDYIRDNASGDYRNKTLLDELQKSIEEVSSNGHVNWTLFKKASRQWIAKVLRNRQDNNNNIAKDDSHDDSVGRYDDEKRASGDGGESDREIGDLEDQCRKKPKTPRRFVTADFVNLSNVSSYSPSSDTHGSAMSDTTPESADETGVGIGCNEVSQVDLRLRVRRFDEENALLREELVRAEELASGLQRQFEKLRRKLEQTNDKCRQLERENDEYKEILTETEAKERECRWALQKIEKERGMLAKKLEDSEADRQQVIGLTSKLEKYKKEKLDCTRVSTKCQQDLELKKAECEMLWKKLVQIEEANDTLCKSYEKTIRHLREKNQELKSKIFDLQIQRGVENPSHVGCSTPPTSYLDSCVQSTPYSNGKDLQLQDSLYNELKASGFSIEEAANESKLRDLEDELTWYHEEIRDAVNQIDDILERANQQRRVPHVPDLSLDESASVKTADIHSLQQKLSRLSNAVNEIIWKPEVKDASSQVSAFTAQIEQPISSWYGIPSFEDSLRFSREKLRSETTSEEANNARRMSDVFVEAFSMNSRSLCEQVEEVEVTESAEKHREADERSTSRKGSMLATCGIQENTIIDPIVDEIDRILQCANKYGEAPTKNSRHRCIYTCTQPNADLIAYENSIRDSTPNSPKRLERELATTYVISSGGDAPPPGMVNNSNKNEENTEDQSDLMITSVSCNETSNTLDENFVSESMTDSTNLEDAKPLENETLAGETVDSKLVDLSSSTSLNLAETPTPSGKLFVVGRSDPPTGTTYCATPNQSIRNFPKRKISVFHRSFDIDTLHAGAGSDTYRLTERSMSTPGNSEPAKRGDDSMELDHDCMKYTPDTRNFLLNTYRTNDAQSDSSESPSPVKPLRLDQDNNNSSLGEVPSRSRQRPIILAPTKLNLPLLKEIPAHGDKTMEKNSKVDENKEKIEAKDDVEYNTDLTVNETQETYDLSNLRVREKDSQITDASFASEMIRPGDEIERGITYRRSSFSRDSDFSAYSLLSPLEDSSVDDKRDDKKVESVSTVVLSDGESTSCDSSPKREMPIAQSTLKLTLLSTYEKPGERVNAGQDPSKSRGSRHVERTAGGARQTRDDDGIGKSNAGSYGSGGVGGVTRSSVEKASVVPAVAPAMSSGEDTSDSECDPMAIRVDDERRNVVDETRSISPTVQSFANGAVLSSSTPAPNIAKSEFTDLRGDCGTRNPMAQKRDKRERLHTMRRSLSESGCGRSECSCRCCNAGNSAGAETNGEETRPMAFPSLTDARLQESGIANLSSTDELGGNLTEADLEKKYTALSVGLVTDRVTLPRRVALSIRQRDQSEINLASEVQKMQQDIQDLAPLCIDRESVERVERVRHQLEMINQCAHRVSCTAETLGAVHQERRVSRAVLLADRYLLVLRSRCEKLTADLAETKRILTENNIVVEENNGELGDDMPRIRYRGMPTNNRTMMARRRASIATIFRPLGNFQDVTKDGVRQRNSVSGRVTLRRPSLSAESQKWEAEKLDRTDSSSSISELREIFEQAESRRASREENNNVLRQHSSNLSVRDCEHADGDVWSIPWEEPVAELPAIVNGGQENRLARRASLPYWSTNINQIPWKLMFWCIMISFLLGFYVKHAVSSVNGCSSTPMKWWSFEEYVERYFTVRNDAQRPI